MAPRRFGAEGQESSSAHPLLALPAGLALQAGDIAAVAMLADVNLILVHAAGLGQASFYLFALALQDWPGDDHASALHLDVNRAGMRQHMPQLRADALP